MTKHRLLVMLASVSMIGGCAIKPQGLASCGFVRRDLAVIDPQASSATEPYGGRKASRQSLAGDMLAALDAHAGGLGAGERDAMLFLSGGSLNGAYGAGFLDQWRLERGRLPEFAVVTGISTGAILATFAFTGETAAMVDGYTIASERELLNPYVKSGAIGAGAAVTLLRKGALADLNPLRGRLATALTDRVLTTVKDGGKSGRKLFVGAVDVGSGEAVAFDLTDMAARWFAAPPGERDKLKICYVEAVLASSSAPIAAPPVFIDERMYIDGGARFGVFSDEIGRVLEERVAAAGLAEAPPRTYVIINGDQRISDETPPPGPHPKYTFLDLAFRSEQILANQVYRFSADRIAARARLERRDFFFTKIDESAGAYTTDLDGPGGEPAQRCSAWKEADRRADRPLQFYPRYMRCLISYGRSRATEALPSWDARPN